MIKTLIVDDEQLVRERVRTLLASFPEFQVLDECADGEAALKKIGASSLDVVFMDIKMPNLDGFEVAANLEPPLPLIVFITAYDEYAVAAFEASAVDYLLKPIDPVRFGKAIERVLARLNQPANVMVSQFIQSKLVEPSPLRRLAVRDGKYTRLINTQEIEWIEANGNYVNVYVGQQSYLVRMAIKTLEQKLDSESFVRAHRSAIVNIDRILKIEQIANADYVLHLQNNSRVVTSRTGAKRIRQLLSID